MKTPSRLQGLSSLPPSFLVIVPNCGHVRSDALYRASRRCVSCSASARVEAGKAEARLVPTASLLTELRESPGRSTDGRLLFQQTASLRLAVLADSIGGFAVHQSMWSRSHPMSSMVDLGRRTVSADRSRSLPPCPWPDYAQSSSNTRCSLIFCLRPSRSAPCGTPLPAAVASQSPAVFPFLSFAAPYRG